MHITTGISVIIARNDKKKKLQIEKKSLKEIKEIFQLIRNIFYPNEK